MLFWSSGSKRYPPRRLFVQDGQRYKLDGASQHLGHHACCQSHVPEFYLRYCWVGQDRVVWNAPPVVRRHALSAFVFGIMGLFGVFQPPEAIVVITASAQR